MTITIEQAKKLAGTEFIYVFEDGDEIPAYVKVISDEGMSCFSLEPKTRDGWAPEPDKDTLPDGTFCIYGLEVYDEADLEKILNDLEKIVTTGYHRAEDIPLGFNGCPF